MDLGSTTPSMFLVVETLNYRFVLSLASEMEVADAVLAYILGHGRSQTRQC